MKHWHQKHATVYESVKKDDRYFEKIIKLEETGLNEFSDTSG